MAGRIMDMRQQLQDSLAKEGECVVGIMLRITKKTILRRRKRHAM